MIIESVARGLCPVASWGKAVQSSGEGAMEVPGIAAFGKVGADGTIVLTPLASVLKRALLAWESRQLRESRERVLAQGTVGETADLEDIAQFAPDDDESQRAPFISCSPLSRTPS